MNWGPSSLQGALLVLLVFCWALKPVLRPQRKWASASLRLARGLASQPRPAWSGLVELNLDGARRVKVWPWSALEGPSWDSRMRAVSPAGAAYDSLAGARSLRAPLTDWPSETRRMKVRLGPPHKDPAGARCTKARPRPLTEGPAMVYRMKARSGPVVCGPGELQGGGGQSPLICICWGPVMGIFVFLRFILFYFSLFLGAHITFLII